MTSLEVESQQKNMQQLELDLKTQEIARLREVHESELQELKQERNQLEKEVLEGRHKIDELQEVDSEVLKLQVMNNLLLSVSRINKGRRLTT